MPGRLVLRGCTAVLIVGIFCQAPLQARPQVTSSDGPALQRFEQAAHEYARLRRIVQAHLAPVEVTADPDAILEFFDAFSAGVRAARPAARQGDLFTPVVSAIVRMRIAEALEVRGIDADDLRGEMVEGTVTPMQVNGPYIWSAPATMVACVLDILPPLPAGLQYRFVGEDLFLIDADAGLVVDILPGAMPVDETRSPRLAEDGGAL